MSCWQVDHRRVFIWAESVLWQLRADTRSKAFWLVHVPFPLASYWSISCRFHRHLDIHYRCPHERTKYNVHIDHIFCILNMFPISQWLIRGSSFSFSSEYGLLLCPYIVPLVHIVPLWSCAYPELVPIRSLGFLYRPRIFFFFSSCCMNRVWTLWTQYEPYW